MMRLLGLVVVLVCAAAVAACSAEQDPATSAARSPGEELIQERVPDPARATPKARSSWRKARYIPVDEAVARLQPYVDVPIVLPRDREAGLPNLRGWLADPKYLEWGSVDGARAGNLKLVKGQKILLISYGRATFDGCGGRDFAIRTKVSGQPALLTTVPRNLWSAVIWPVTPGGSTGRYGLTGTFEGWQLVKLAESMESARLEAIEGRHGCL
ncbi:MAG TPA: hypothetical protein VM784_14325 [Actinomycetota bacterium]|nr:hypothetical protein [Actinomycetota bacterium]